MLGTNIHLLRLKASAVLAVCYCIFGVLGLVSVGALLVFSSKSCERPTCILKLIDNLIEYVICKKKKIV